MIDRTNLSIRGRELFIVSIADKDPKFAQDYVNTLVGEYVEENLSAKRDETYGANRFLEEQIAIFKEKLEAAEDKIIQFRKDNGIYFSIDEAATLANIRESGNTDRRRSFCLRTHLNARKKQIQQQTQQILRRPSTWSLRVRRVVVCLKWNRDLRSLLLRYTENYPEVIRLKSEIDELKRDLASKGESAGDSPDRARLTSLNPLYQQLQTQIYDIDAELSSLAARKLNLDKTIAKREQELREVPEAQKELRILVQERDSIRNVYEELLGRMSQSEVSKQMEISNKTATFRIVDPAVLPKVPVSPNMLKMFLLALVGGLTCGVGVVYLLETMDGRIRDASVLENAGFEVLAVIPHILESSKVKKQRQKDLLLCVFGGLYFVCFAGVFGYVLFLS